MNFLGYESPVEYKGIEVFDPTAAKMVLDAQDKYFNAIYADYLLGIERMKEFNKEYGDFITPILKDLDWYNQNITGRVRNFINDAYSKGIDLTRSAEGRAAISQLINSIPVGDVAKLRSSAKNAEEYLKNRGKLEAAGLYNPDLEERYLDYNLANWDTLRGDKIWDRVSPTEAKTLKEATEAWYNNRTPEMLTEADVKSFGLNYDPRYNYTGFADRHLLDIAAGETPGWRGSLYADYYRDLAERKVAAKGLPYTQGDVERQLQQDIATANREYKSIKRDADEFAKLDQQHKNAIDLDNRRTANDNWLDKLKQAREHYYRGLENLEKTKNIFREAEALLPGQNGLHDSIFKTKAGMNVGYIPSGQYQELIDPVIPASYVEGKDKASGQIVQKFRFDASKIKGNVYTIDEAGNVTKSLILSKGDESSKYDFTPDGHLKAAITPDGQYEYYISGTLRGNSASGAAYRESDNSTLIWIKVKERGYVYDGKKQKTTSRSYAR